MFTLFASKAYIYRPLLSFHRVPRLACTGFPESRVMLIPSSLTARKHSKLRVATLFRDLRSMASIWGVPKRLLNQPSVLCQPLYTISCTANLFATSESLRLRSSSNISYTLFVIIFALSCGTGFIPSFFCK